MTIVACKRLFLNFWGCVDDDGRGYGKYRDLDVLLAEYNPEIETPNVDKILSARSGGDEILTPMFVRDGACLHSRRLETEEEILDLLLRMDINTVDEE